MLTVTAVVLAKDWAKRLLMFHVYRPPWLADVEGFARATGWGWVILVNLAALLLAVAAAAVLVVFAVRFFRGAGRHPVVAAATVVAAVAMTVVSFTVKAPENVIYERYRERRRRGGRS